jgi:hypothetical protein
MRILEAVWVLSIFPLWSLFFYLDGKVSGWLQIMLPVSLAAVISGLICWRMAASGK